MRVEYRGMALIVPETDSEWHGYFDAARGGRLVVRRCGGCGLLRYPPGVGCPWCRSLEWTWQPVSGRGTIHSYEIVVQAIQPGFRDWAPEREESVAIGVRVEVCFQPLAADFALPQFRLSGEPPGGPLWRFPG